MIGRFRPVATLTKAWYSEGGLTNRRLATVSILALIIVQLTLYCLLTVLSWQFHFHSDGASRPLIGVGCVLTVLFLAYLASIPLALGLGHTRRWLLAFFVVAIAFRGILLFSEPIQEVNLYRYIWDGAVADQGVSPYRYRPNDIRIAIASGGSEVSEVDQLARLAMASDGLQQALYRVHFPQVPTVYPPVSQVVFQFVNRITPPHAALTTRVRVMKLVIALFDVGAVGLVWMLLRLLGQNEGWFVAYAWSPLVIKEFANSGHLDSITVFLTVASIVCIVRSCHLSRAAGEVGCRSGREGLFPDSQLPSPRPENPTSPGGRGDDGLPLTDTKTNSQTSNRVFVTVSGILAGLAVGAKLYPIILFPLTALYVWKRLGRNAAILWSLVACLFAVSSLAPMLFIDRSTDQLEGLTTFISHWEMNDLLFMVIEENIRPEGSIPGQPPLWFAITPDSWRVQLVNVASTSFGGDIERTPFLLTRLVTTTMFAAVVFWLCRRTWKQPDRFAESAFLTIAWFWFLSPTQNPWYWTWALPLVPFARDRIWLLVSGLALIYYSRFWFEYHGDVVASWGTAYQGVQFFDFIVVWIAFGPILFAMCLLRPIQKKFPRATQS